MQMNSTIRRALVVLAAILLSAPLVAPRAADTPSPAGSFPLGVYWPWERTEGLAKRNGLEKWALKPRDVRDLRHGQVLQRTADNTVAVKLGPGDGTVLEEAP